MTSFFAQASVFLIQVLFGFYILAVLLRLLFQMVRADFYNPISQFLVVLTNPPLLPLRRFIPGLFGVDLASVALLLVLKSLELYLVFWIRGFAIHPVGLIVFATSELLTLSVYVFIVAILIRVIMSWVNPYGLRRHPASDLLHSLTEPLLRPARRLIPPIAGLDLSPIAVLVLLQLAIMLVENVTTSLVQLTL